jgi:hypothetical protein
VNPVGGPVAGAGEAFGIDKSLQPEDGMMVDFLPILGNGPGDAAKQMGGEMRNGEPGQHKESAVVGQQVAIALSRLRRPTEEGVATVDGVWRRGKGEASDQPVTGIDQIFEMFADRLAITQIVILPDQGIEELLLRRSSDLSQHNGAKITQGNRERSWLKIKGRGSFSSSQGIVIVVNNPGRKR